MKKKICFVVIVFCFFMFFCVKTKADGSAYYDTKASYNEEELEVSSDVLKNVKKYTEVHKGDFGYGALMKEEYELHIYHYVPSRTGFYNAYTTGVSNTILKVYREKKIFGYTTGFEDMGKSSSVCLTSYSRNASLALRFNKGEDYYICVRMHSNNKGFYNIFIEANLDKMSTKFNDYKEWNVNEHATLIENLHRICDYKKLYLSKEQVILFYWALCSENPDETKVVDSNGNVIYLSDLYHAYDEDFEKFVSLCFKVLSILAGFFGDYGPYVSKGIKGLDYIFKITYNASTNTKKEMRNILNEKCGADYVLVDQYWEHGEFYEIKKYIAKKELCIIYREIKGGDSLSQNLFKTIIYEGYDSEIREGYEYDKGNWE